MSIRTKNEVSATNIDSKIIKKDGVFKFPNGDEYRGQFTADKDNLTLTMEGKGTYVTKDNHRYNGIWENNTLSTVYGIEYPDDSIFYGHLDNMVMQGTGIYKFKDNIELEGNFVNNRLVGKVCVTDPNGHSWIGKSNSADRDLFFNPTNQFWESVLNIKREEQSVYGEIEENESLNLVSEDSSSYEK